MGKTKGKKQPKKNPKAEQKNARRNDHSLNRQSALHRAFSSGWVQNSSVGFAIACAFLLGAAVTKTGVKAAAITCAAVGTVALWILAFAFVRYSAEPEGVTFTLLAKFFDGSHKADRGNFWCRYRSGFGDTLSPAPAVLYLTIKNLTASPLYIEHIEISVQKKREKWMTLRHIPSEICRLYWIYGDLTKASLLDMDTLDKRLHSSIPAGETVPGWLFLATSSEYPVSEGDRLRWRFLVKDSTGATSEYVSPFEEINNKPESSPSVSQPVPIRVTGIKEDLSNLNIRLYEPFPYK